jgi:hypothetical protein
MDWPIGQSTTLPYYSKSIVQGSVDQFFDTHIYQEVLSDNPQETVDRLIQERVRFI